VASRRNIHACPKEVKEAAHTTLVRPSIEYASAVWDPFNKNQISQLDSVQRRAARFASARVYIALKAAIHLVLLSAGMSRCSAWISTKLCTILYIKTDLASRCISLFLLPSYHHHLEQHTTRCTSDQYYRPVPGRARVYYPSRAVPGVNSTPPCF
jgi:hypothetical protein